jgi:sugar O-acyltransferase (sialic acid O-acetyltransferase NeuD family)
MTRYLIIGAAGYAQEVAWSLRAQIDAGGAEAGPFVFFDDRVPPGPLPSGLGDVAGTLDEVARHATPDAALVLGIGLPKVKRRVVDRLAATGLRWVTVVHPSALLGPNLRLDEGTYIGAGAIVTVNATIGRFVTVNLHCQVAHEDVLGDFVTLHPDVHLSGDVVIEEGCELGTGAIAIPGVRIGAWAILGAASVAVKSLAGGATYVGTPAREVTPRVRLTGVAS